MVNPLHSRPSILTLATASALLLGACRKNREQPPGTENRGATPEPAASRPVRLSVQFGEWHVAPDSVAYSEDGSRSTFSGRVQLAHGSGQHVGIYDGTDDPESTVSFYMSSKDSIEMKGRFRSSKLLGLAPHPAGKGAQ